MLEDQLMDDRSHLILADRCGERSLPSAIFQQVLAFWLLSSSAIFANDALIMPAEKSVFRLDLRPSVEAVSWASDDPPPALLDSDDSVFFAPVLRLDADGAAGDHWFFHSSLRADRGFDAVSRESGDIRLDEVFLRWRVGGDQRLNFQIGRFPTAFGGWVAGHDFFDDPFLSAPLPYSQIIGVQTRDPAAMTPAAIAARASGAAPPVSRLSKQNWASLVWGPSYGTGASVFGATEHFDYALELKNASLSSHSDSWEGNGFEDPAVTARVGWRPDAAWALGASASRGPWLEDNVPGLDRADLQQTTIGLDVRWAHRDFIVTSEIVLSEFETPAAGDLCAASWYLSGRWKFSEGMWLAARFGQMIANDATAPAGGDVEWQPDVWRAELAAGWRVTSSILLKASYGFTHTDDNAGAGEHLLGAGIGWRF